MSEKNLKANPNSGHERGLASWLKRPALLDKNAWARSVRKVEPTSIALGGRWEIQWLTVYEAHAFIKIPRSWRLQKASYELIDTEEPFHGNRKEETSQYVFY